MAMTGENALRWLAENNAKLEFEMRGRNLEIRVKTEPAKLGYITSIPIPDLVNDAKKDCLLVDALERAIEGIEHMRKAVALNGG